MLSVQIVGSSLKYLQGELNASIEQISYVMSASLITEVIIIPFSGWLIRLLSTKVFFMISLSGFIFASTFSLFAHALGLKVDYQSLPMQGTRLFKLRRGLEPKWLHIGNLFIY